MNLLLNSDLSAIVDIVALSLVGFYALWGLIRGFVKTFFSAFGTILSLLFAILLAPSVAQFLQDKFQFVDTVSSSIGDLVSGYFGEDVMHLTLEQVSREYLASAGVSGFIIDIILSLQLDGTAPLNTTLHDIICPTFAYYVVIIVAVIALFIVLKLIFRLICDIVKKMHSIKGVARADKLLGFVLGMVHGIIVLEFVIMAIKVIPIGVVQDVYVAVHASSFANFIEKISLFNGIMGMLTKANIVGFIKGLL